jgi:hypothetical protein
MSRSDIDIPILIKFDKLLLMGVDKERTLSATGVRRDGRPKCPARTTMLRTLVRESLDARMRARGEEPPVLSVIPSGDGGDGGDGGDDEASN